MSNLDRNHSLSHHAGPGDSSGGSVSESLKTLIAHLANQIADADQRHADMLEEMQARLRSLGIEARAIHDRVPGEYLPAFTRIEEGMQLLAERLAASQDAWPGHRGVAELPAADTQLDSDHPADTASDAATDVSGLAHRDDGFDSAGPWSREAAEALADLYHSGSALPTGSTPGPGADQPAELDDVRSSRASTSAIEIERGWLEDRFAEIARRIEHSLADIRPDSSLLAFGRRFEQFEARMETVLADVATRSDVDGLRLVEAHITELAQHLELTQRQLGRLDGIEARLAAVADKLAHPSNPPQGSTPPLQAAQLEDIIAQAADRVAAQLAGSGVGPGSDYQTIAVRAAEEAVSRIIGDGRRPEQAAGGGEDLRVLIEGLIREHRHGEEQTAAVLDTMQQAMISLLDRIDGSETHAQEARATAPSFAGFGGDLRNSTDLRLSSPPEERFAPAEPKPATPSLAASAAVAAEPVQPPKSSIDRLRQEFIADAQRAKLRAQAEAVEEAAVASAPAAAKSGKPGKPASAQAQKKPSNPSTKSSLGGMPIKKILVAALGLVILFQGANLILARRKAEAPKPAAAQTLPVAPAPGKSSADAPRGQPSLLNPSADRAPVADPGREGTAAGSRDAQPAEHERPGATRPAGPAKFTLPTVPGRPATVPETVVDDLSLGEPQTDRTEQVIAAASQDWAPRVPLGIALDETSDPPTPFGLAKLQQQQQMAIASSRLGAAAARTTPSALLPEMAVTPVGLVSANAEKPALGRSALELPPATVGPLSLRLAAANGDPSAEFEVGARLAEGKGTDQSFKEAVKWYTRSANQGFAQSQFRLATLYERGLGVKTDLGRARVWYGRAAEQGNVKAMHNIAVLSAGSKSSAPDYAAAAHWFGEAAARGLADSQFNLAVLYDAGLGVAQDQGLAYQWFALAARSGDKEAVRRRDLARSAMSPAAAAAIDKRVASWQPLAVDPMANDARVAGEAWKGRANSQSEG